MMKYTITNGKSYGIFFEKIRLLSGAYSGMISLICKYHSKFYKKEGNKKRDLQRSKGIFGRDVEIRKCTWLRYDSRSVA